MIALINPITTVRLEGNSHFVAKTPVYTIMNNVQKIANQLPRRQRNVQKKRGDNSTVVLRMWEFAKTFEEFFT
jgi:hypothetical protein